MPAYWSSSAVTRPVGPSVARKAKASGMPANCEATPLKVVTNGRSARGSLPSTTA